jgi:alpha-2-macroglobulin
MNKSFFLLFLPVLFLMPGCKPKSGESYPHSPFHSAVSAFTSGHVSAASPIMIEFAGPVDIAVPGEDAAASLLKITPSVRAGPYGPATGPWYSAPKTTCRQAPASGSR